MTKSRYNNIRAAAIRIFGIFMLANGLLLAITAPAMSISQNKNCTEYVLGEVTRVEEDTLWIYYELPGDGEQWHVTRTGEGWEAGDEVRVFYNPADLSEKYIEGFDEGFPWMEIVFGIIGVAIGIGALIVSSIAKKSEKANAVIDVFDQS